MSIKAKDYTCVDCDTIGIRPFKNGDGLVRCQVCADAKHKRELWSMFTDAAEIIIDMNDPQWQDQNSWFQNRLARLCRRYGTELIKVIKADDTGQRIRVGKAGNGFRVRSYNDIISTIRHPWAQACYDHQQRLARPYLSGS